MGTEHRQTHQLSTGNIVWLNPSTRFYEGFLAREGNGGGIFMIAGTAT